MRSGRIDNPHHAPPVSEIMRDTKRDEAHRILPTAQEPKTHKAAWSRSLCPGIPLTARPSHHSLLYTREGEGGRGSMQIHRGHLFVAR